MLLLGWKPPKEQKNVIDAKLNVIGCRGEHRLSVIVPTPLTAQHVQYSADIQAVKYCGESWFYIEGQTSFCAST
jgi:hypothetical protein